MQVEYARFQVPKGDYHANEERSIESVAALNKLGSAGWQMVGLISYSGPNDVGIFMRQKPPKSGRKTSK